MKAAVAISDGRLIVRTKPGPLRSVVGGLPAARWRGADRAHAMPPTIAAAGNLSAVLHSAKVEASWDEASAELLERAIYAVDARKFRDAEDLPDLPDPAGVNKPAYLHQRQAYRFALYQEGVGLWIAMGGGKSRVAAVLAHEWKAERILVTCPRAVLDEDDVWKKEFAKWIGPDVEVYGRVYGRGGKPKAKPSVPDRLKVLQKGLAEAEARGRRCALVVPVDSYWRGELGKWLLGLELDLWIVDEIHKKLKAPGGKAAMFGERLAHRARRRLGLSGTPLAHSRLDAYAEYRILDAAVFGTNYSRFKNRYAVTVPLPNAPRAEKVVGWQNEDEFDRKFHSIAYRWEKDRKVLGLEEPVTIDRHVTLTAETRRVYEDLDQDLIADVGKGVVVAGNALVRVLRLQQVCSGVVTLADGAKTRVGSEKKDALADELDNLPVDEPVVVYCLFHTDLDAVAEVCRAQGRRFAELSGRTHGGLDVWKAGGADVIAVQIAAGGAGIDLTRAAYGIYLSPTFSLVDTDQSKERLDRPGQLWPVTFVRIIARGTVDEEIYEANDERRDGVQAVYDARRRLAGKA